jgi:protein TonB
MRSSPGRPFSFGLFPNESNSWHRRLVENITQLFSGVRLSPSSANGAPLHSLDLHGRRRSFGRAQGCSLAAHLAVATAVALTAHHVVQNPAGIPDRMRPIFYPANVDGQKWKPLANPSNGVGNGGHHDSVPATKGHLAFRSVIPIIPPRPPQNENPELPVIPTVPDPLAPSHELRVQNSGLPWMPNENNSQGPGGPEGYGTTRGHSMGDSDEDGPGGTGHAGNYSRGTSFPRCVYCPDPSFSEEARSAKLQGTVTLQLLVKPDGRVTNARVTRGLGLGLDEKALEAVRTWQFKPGREPNGRAVAAWLTVEVTFHLY